ncbi:MAG TPA: Rrf2 family transcriptional regulator [Terriglobales bacterium]|nr:Rrf2 family transcriptional regulator [Terriglobales bacterium]
MLKLTKKADYGLIAMKYLAEQPATSAKSAKEIAEAQKIPSELLAKILQRLVRAKLLVSLQGTNGGYKLARDSRTISAFDVIKAIEGPLFITSCVTHKGACEQTSRCTVKEPLQKVSLAIEEVLSKVTIFELAQTGEGSCEGSQPGMATPQELVSLN